MATFKFQCPGCSVRMVAPAKLPAKLTCPKCQAKFILSPDGTTGPRETPFSRDAPAEREPAPKIRAKPGSAGFMQRLQSLPKPILFGLYGAIGGLLGVLLLGELCIALIQPKTKEMPPLRLAMHPAINVYHGGKNSFPVSIDAKDLNGPVVLEVLDLPNDVAVARMVVPAGATEAEMDVAVGQPEDTGVKPRALPLRLRASSEKQPEKSVEQPFHLNIEPLPRRVMLAFPSAVSVYPGDKNVIPIKIVRHGFTGPVRLELIGDLPDKVNIQPAPIAADKTESTIEVAVKDLPFGEYPVKLRAIPETPNVDSATMSIMIKVVPVPPVVQLAVPPTVVVYSGGKNRFGIKIARQRFEGPVRITIPEPPPGIKFTPVIIPAGSSEAEVELAAPELPSGQSAEHRVFVLVTMVQRLGLFSVTRYATISYAFHVTRRLF